jgi:hypothetical protein
VRVLTLLAAGLALAASASASAAPPLVTVHGFGGATPGMRVQQVESTLGVDLDVQTLGPGGSCGTAILHVPGLRGYALFLHGRLGSLWFERGVRTDRGVRIGSSLGALRAAYPKLRSRPSKYVPNARDYFVRRPGPPHWRLRFDVSAGGNVTSIAFGNTSVFLVEGCA